MILEFYLPKEKCIRVEEVGIPVTETEEHATVRIAPWDVANFRLTYATALKLCSEAKRVLLIDTDEQGTEIDKGIALAMLNFAICSSFVAVDRAHSLISKILYDFRAGYLK